jgi:DNA replication and repair protein RecF
LEYINNSIKNVFDLKVTYDKSIISNDRLLQYKDQELAAGATLVGPHRDDFSILMHPNINTANKSELNESELKDIKFFGSRGEQRLAVLQLKIIELSFLKENLEEVPLLLLDDIFSELDSEHIELVLKMTKGQQTIITTTHKEFMHHNMLDNVQIISLSQ